MGHLVDSLNVENLYHYKLIKLADEPTGNLDGATGAAVMDLLFEMQAKSGATLMLITHSMETAERCARHLQIADGKIISDTAAI
mgnify:CR=1 FL=1